MPVPTIPENYLCKITHQVMLDPVIADDGFTYAREAIITWFREHDTSPMTREKIGNRLIPNRDTKAMIMDFLDNNSRFIHEAIASSNPKHDNLEFIIAVIKKNIDNLNKQDEAGQTPLHVAVINRNKNIIQLLLQSGADYKIRNNQHKTPKNVAKEQASWDIVDIIECEIKSLEQKKIEELEKSLGRLRLEDGSLEGNQPAMIIPNPDDRQQLPRPVIPARQYFNYFGWQAVQLLALTTGVAAVGVAVQGHRRLNEQNESIDALTTELSNLKMALAQEKQAVSFLYDKMKDAHKVYFKTQYFPPQDVAAQFNDGTYTIPVPDGFQEQDCSFFSVSRGNNKGHGQPILSNSGASRVIAPAYAPWGNWLEATYGVLAAKPVISEEEANKKKRQYKLIT